MHSKIFRIVLLMVVLLLAFATVAAWLLNNDAFVRKQLSRQLSNATGWQLEIQGDFVVDWGRQSRLHASQVRLVNPQWAENPLMFSAGDLQLVWQPLKLWGSELVIDDLQIKNCSANYLEYEERSNWQPLTESEQAENKPSDLSEPSDQSDFSWQLQNLGLSHCQIGIRRLRHDHILDLRLDQAQLQTLPDNVLSASIQGVLEQQALQVQAKVSPMTALWQGGMMHHELKLQAGEINLQSSGSIADFKFGDGADLQVRFSGPEFSDITELLAWPDLSSGPFDATLNLREQAGESTGFELKGDFGSLQFNGIGHLDRLVDPQDGALDLQIKGPDLAAMGELLDQHWLIQHEFELSVKAGLQQGKTRLSSLLLQAGENRIDAKGVLGPLPTLVGSDLQVTVHSPELAQWQPVTPKKTLKGIHLFGPLDADIGITVNPDAELLLDIKGSLSANRFSVQGNLGQGSLGLRPAGGHPNASIVLESASLKQFARLFERKDWPDQPFSLSGKLVRAEDGVQLNHVQLKMAADTLDMNGKLVLGEEWQGSEFTALLKLANLSVTGSRFGLKDLPEQPLSLKSTLQWQGHGMKFNVSDGSLGDIRIRMHGNMPDLKNPLVLNSIVDLDLPSARIAEFLLPGSELPDLPLAVKGELVNSASSTRLKGFNIQLGQNQANLEGEWQTAGNHLDSNFTLQIKGREVRDLWPNAPQEVELGAYTLSAHWLRKADGDYVQTLKADLGILKLAADGRVSNASRQADFDLKLGLSGADASRFKHFTGQPFASEPYTLQLKLQGNAQLLQFNDIDLKLGKSDLAGHLQLDLGLAARPALSGALTSKQLDASPWQQAIREKSLRDQAQASKQTTAKKGTRKSKQKLFTDQPFNLVQDLPWNLDLDLQIAEVLLQGTAIHKINLGLRIKPDQLQLQPAEFQSINGGRYVGQLNSKRIGGISDLDMLVKVDDLKLGIVGVSGLDPARLPPSDIFVKLTGRGNTWHDMAQSINGRLRWYQGSGWVAKSGLNFIFSDFLTEFLDTLNPMNKKSALSQLSCSVYAADAVNGQVKVAPIVYQTDQVTAFSEGTIDLSTEMIDLNFRTVARKGLGLSAGSVVNPFFRIGGTLVKPALHLDVTKGAISSGVMVATAGLSVLFKSVSDRLLASKDPCGDARKALEQHDSEAARQ